MATNDDIRTFESLSIDDVPLVGGKTASLGELHRLLRRGPVRVPNGFAITAQAYREALRRADAMPRLTALMRGLDVHDLAELSGRASAARGIVYDATGSAELRAQIVAAFHGLRAQCGQDISVAVRSSATAEDLPTASFAGQHDSFLHVRDEDALFEACRRCFASLFTDRAIVYRVNNGFDHLKVALSVAVMQMVDSDDSASGVVFTLDTESGFRDVVFVTGAYGLGENIVQGRVDPDEWYVHKPTFRQGVRAVLRRSLGAKQTRITWKRGGGVAELRTRATPRAERERFCLADDEVLQLAEVAMRIEDHYSARSGRPTPMDIEWAKSAADGRIYVVQARPETVASQRSADVENFHLKGSGPLLVSGKAVGERIAAGPVRLVRGPADLRAFRPGEVLVAAATNPDWEPVMKQAAAVVTDRGGRTCHAAIIARELGVPAVVGAAGATEKLADGARVTVSCAEGETGRVYAGDVPFAVERIRAAELQLPRTHVMLNLAHPGLAFRFAQLPSAGVGLARLEFIIGEQIRLHPMAAAHPERGSRRPVTAPRSPGLRAATPRRGTTSWIASPRASA